MHYPKEKVYCYYTIFFTLHPGLSQAHPDHIQDMEKPVPMQKIAKTKIQACAIFFLVNKLYFHSSSYYFYIYIELSTLKNEDTNGESATPQRPGSAIKSARPRTGTYQSLLDNAPNYLVGFIIQKR